LLTKKQIVAEVKEDAQEHRVLNDRQEKEDDARVDHAVKELDKENEIAELRTANKSFQNQMLELVVFLHFL